MINKYKEMITNINEIKTNQDFSILSIRSTIVNLGVDKYLSESIVFQNNWRVTSATFTGADHRAIILDLNELIAELSIPENNILKIFNDDISKLDIDMDIPHGESALVFPENNSIELNIINLDKVISIEKLNDSLFHFELAPDDEAWNSVSIQLPIYCHFRKDDAGNYLFPDVAEMLKKSGREDLALKLLL